MSLPFTMNVSRSPILQHNAVLIQQPAACSSRGPYPECPSSHSLADRNLRCFWFYYNAARRYMPQSGMTRSDGNSRFNCLNIAAYQRLCTEQRCPVSCSSVKRQYPNELPEGSLGRELTCSAPHKQKTQTQAHTAAWRWLPNFSPHVSIALWRALTCRDFALSWSLLLP